MLLAGYRGDVPKHLPPLPSMMVTGAGMSEPVIMRESGEDIDTE